MAEIPYTAAVAGEITTFTGRVFRPLDPDPAKINIVDIAHALSNQCRFTGHVRQFYSVAEHSVRVAEISVDPLWGLLHDASEAYISDLASPLKMMSELGDPYREVEERLMKVIADRFDLVYPMPRAVKRADRRLLAAEQRDLMPRPRRETVEQEYAETIWPWTPDFARARFLMLYEELTGEKPRR